MTATQVVRFVNQEPGRGKVYTGIYDILLTGYVNGTGFTLDADTFGLKVLKQLLIQPVDCGGAYSFDWNPDTCVLTIFNPATATEIANDGADGDTVRVVYWGFR